LSRHKPLPSQIAELNRIFGHIDLVMDANPFSDVSDIVKRFREGGYDAIVVVAPLSVIAQLIKMGIKPLWAEMQRVNCKEEAETKVSGRYYRFVKFKRIKRIKIEFEEL